MILTQQFSNTCYNSSYLDPSYTNYQQTSQLFTQYAGVNIIDYNAIASPAGVKNNLSNSKMKTSLCNKWTQKGSCPYGAKCQFAHGIDELRCNVDENSYKTKECNAFFKKGFCPYGFRCNFSHKPVSADQQCVHKFKQNPKLIGYSDIVQHKKQRQSLIKMMILQNPEQSDIKSITSTDDSKSDRLKKSRFDSSEQKDLDELFQNCQQNYLERFHFHMLKEEFQCQGKIGQEINGNVEDCDNMGQFKGITYLQY